MKRQHLSQYQWFTIKNTVPVLLLCLFFSQVSFAEPTPPKAPPSKFSYHSPLKFGFTTGLSIPGKNYENGLSLATQWVLPSSDDWKIRLRLHYSRYKSTSVTSDTTDISMNIDWMSFTQFAPFYYGVGLGYHFFSSEFSSPLPSIQIHMGHSYFLSRGLYWITEASYAMFISNTDTKKLNPLTIRTGVTLKLGKGNKGRKKQKRYKKRFKRFR